MKQISQISNGEIEKHLDDCVMVYEKLDMIYFKIYVTSDGWHAIKNSKGKTIDNVDAVVNSVYRNIKDFADAFDTLGAYKKYGDFSAGFFYLPVHKTKTITYDGIKENTFILSDYYVKDKSLRDDKSFANFVGKEFNFISGWNGEIGPYIGNVKLGWWINEHTDFLELAECIFKMMNVDKSISGKRCSEIEGLVLKFGNKSYEIMINNTYPLIESSSKLIYRDMLLENFIHTIPDETRNSILASDKDYIGKICDLFMEFIDSTDFFRTMWIEDEDLLPPIEGYIGEMSYDLLPPIVSVICKNNPTFKNVLRVLLVTFNGPMYDNKFKRFKDEDQVILNEIMVNI